MMAGTSSSNRALESGDSRRSALPTRIGIYMDCHTHNFPASEWPFSEAINAITISTRRVVEDDFPILFVTHDVDGDWQILCGTTNELADGLVMCLGCMFQRDRSIGQLADLPRGW
jgi:hypothetical protein